jgi:hypothetical protein
MKNISIQELESHLDHWFGYDWHNQSSAQVWAMVVDLMHRLSVEITDTEGFRTVEQMIEAGEVIKPN